MSTRELNLLDLPNEMLIYIFSKLSITDVFYSLVDVNQRLNRLVLDPIFVHDLKMIDKTKITSLYNHKSSVDPNILRKIYSNVIPRIHQQVQKLTVELHSMKDLLLQAHYPRLYSLSLINCQAEDLYQCLTDDSDLADLLTKQITHLNIDLQMVEPNFRETIPNIFQWILSRCEHLLVLNFCHLFVTRACVRPIFSSLPDTYLPSTITTLTIKVLSLVDCLYILDGRLDALARLTIRIDEIFDPIMKVDGKELPKLKHLTLTSFSVTCEYETHIVPLLRRMINVEELKLYLKIFRVGAPFLDLIQLDDHFLVQMSKLKKFTFFIDTIVSNRDITIELQDHEDIQRSFIERGYEQVAIYIMNETKSQGNCCFYSIPYEFEEFIELDLLFQGGNFDKVQLLEMIDHIPFQYELFRRVSQDFPFLKILHIGNDYFQDDHRFDSSISITFPYLEFLDMPFVHIDYVKLFLMTNTIHLPRLLNLRLQYQSLSEITNCFTTDAILSNFKTVTSLDVGESFVRPEKFHQYFPLL